MKLGKDFLTILVVLSLNAMLAFIFLALMPKSEFIIMYKVVWHSISIEHVFSLMSTLNFTIKYYVGAFFGKPIIYFFATLGVLTLRDLRNEFNRLIISILLPASILSILVDQFWQWRILYMVPYHILAALGFASIIYLFKKLSYTTSRSNAEEKVQNLFLAILILLLILSQFNYALRCMNYIIPS